MSENHQEEAQENQRRNTPKLEKEEATPIPEPKFSVDIKKTRKLEAPKSEQTPRTLPFEIGLHSVSSQEIPPLSLRAGLKDDWMVRPVSLEELESSTPEIDVTPEITLPKLKIWESARLAPLAPLHEPIESVEINLPSRVLLSVEPLETEFGDAEEVKGSEEETEDVIDNESIEQTTTETDEEASTGGEATPEGQDGRSLPSLYEFLFQIPEGSLLEREPICVVAAKRDDDRYKKTLETLCREQFRQHIGGMPRGDLLTSSEADSIENARIQNRIVSYNDSDSDFFEFVTKLDDQEMAHELLEKEGEADLSKLHARIDEFFAETLGYLLLFVDGSYADALYSHLDSAEDIREAIQIVQLRLRRLPDDVKREITRLAWGNVSIDTEAVDLDTIFHSAEDKFSSAIKPSGQIEELTRKDPEDPESELHYWVKCFVVDVLLKQEGLKPLENHHRPELMEQIQTEGQPWGESNPQPDVYNNKSGEVYEVETLYSTDHTKINRTIDKYEGRNVKRINIVLPNLTCLRNFDDILRKRQEEPGEMFKNDVKFWTLDVNDRELLSIDDLTERLSELQERSKHLM